MTETERCGRDVNENPIMPHPETSPILDVVLVVHVLTLSPHMLPQVGVPPRFHLLDARDLNLLHHAAESVAGLREYR